MLSKIINIKLILTCLLGDSVFFNSYIASRIKICLSFLMNECIQIIQGLNTDLGQSLESLHWLYGVCWLVLAVSLIRFGITYKSGRHTLGMPFKDCLECWTEVKDIPSMWVESCWAGILDWIKQLVRWNSKKVKEEDSWVSSLYYSKWGPSVTSWLMINSTIMLSIPWQIFLTQLIRTTSSYFNCLSQIFCQRYRNGNEHIKSINKSFYSLNLKNHMQPSFPAWSLWQNCAMFLWTTLSVWTCFG